MLRIHHVLLTLVLTFNTKYTAFKDQEYFAGFAHAFIRPAVFITNKGYKKRQIMVKRENKIS